ncbi:alpha/beta hydrolase [Jiella sp. MQZ9-1]|uniref:Alpha/beta hydrolase n=1 Tax=Jiella flava TaxID=2816857 RepID=A0A939FX99_9HYPH|nr:alpha/beta hydrolase [Jiella flava]MBO0663192.1 alpha/beta hydrolase [Jiella flava]MCD2471767.1 alpha/beta hydrolase [Jiella flava]
MFKINLLAGAIAVFMAVASMCTAKAEIVDGYAKISDDLTIHYQSTGSGPVAVIFVPGWTMTTKVFEHQMTHLEDSKAVRAVTYDPRAQGLSSLTIEGHYYAQHARDLNALMAKLKINKAVLVGWSAGGGDVLEYLRLFGSSKVAGLILLDTSPKSRTTDYTKDWAWFGTKDEGDQDGFLKTFSYDVMIDRQKLDREFAEWMLDDPSPANIRFVEDMSNHTPNSIAALLNTSYWFLDDAKTVKALDGNIPLLYFTRQEWNKLATQWAKKNTPHAEVISFGKHLSFWEHPEKFNAALDDFLRKVK